MAILADFQDKSPEAILQLITNRLRHVSHSLEELKKYLNQLNVLSRLHNLNEETLKVIYKMPITIDFEKDYLYNQGLEQGLVKGLEKGELHGKAEKTYQTTVNMLKMGFDISAICQALEVEEDYVLKIKKELGL